MCASLCDWVWVRVSVGLRGCMCVSACECVYVCVRARVSERERE